MKGKITILLVLILGLSVLTGFAQDKGTIFYLAPNQFDEFQTTAAKMIKKLVEEAGYECKVLVAGSEGVNLQVSQMEDAVTQDPEAIILAAVNATALAPSVEKARASGVPVIVYDRTITQAYVDFTSVAGCKKMGIIAGKEIVRLLKEKYGEARGKVFDLMGDPGDAYTVLIEEGFQEVMENYPNIDVTTKVNHGWEAISGANIAEDWVVANPDTDLIFSHADHMTNAIASMLETRGIDKGEITLVSTAGMPMGLDLVREGWAAVTVQQPLIAQAKGVAMFLDEIIKDQCLKPGTYEVGGLKAELVYEDYGPVLLIPGAAITKENVDNPQWWGNQATK